MNFLRAREAKILTETENYGDNVRADINLSIYNNVMQHKYHCDWYSPFYYDCSSDFIDLIKDSVVKEIKEEGYKVTMTVFKPNNLFKNTRIKLHINWE